MNVGGNSPRSRVRAPQEHGGTLIDPPLGEVGSLIAQNQGQLDAADCLVLSRPLAELASQARRELVAAARQATSQYRDLPAMPADGPLLLAGHQPQLFHAGVWFKNFVLGGLASSHAGAGINLVIDSDTVRSSSIRVPGGTLQRPTAQAIEFDAPGPQIPFEERDILDRSTFDSFAARAAAEIVPLVSNPLLREFWPLVQARSRDTGNLGACLAQARHILEGQWGLATLELPQSRVCTLPAFDWFAAHLLENLPRLREVYNRSLREYRRMHGVRSRNHPAPELDASDEWLEAPFWIWQATDPRRRRVFVRRRREDLTLTDRAGTEIELAGECLVEALSDLPRRGIKLRTRALMTTLWARLALSDLFLHGIGGAKYDQLTDQIIGQFFGVPAPAYLTATATLRLPIPIPPSPLRSLSDSQRLLRDLEFHPERWLARHPAEIPASDRAEAELACSAKADWIATSQTAANARQRCRGIRSANETLAQWTHRLRDELLHERDSQTARELADAILRSREFAFCLFPSETLRNFLLEFLSIRTYPKAT